MIALAQAEGQLEAIGTPAVTFGGHPAHPFAQVGANRIDAVDPYTLDRRCKLVPIVRSDPVENQIEACVSVCQRCLSYRQEASIAQLAEKFELHFMKERATGQRIDYFDRFGLL